MIGAFRSVYRSKVSTCIVEYVGQYCESKSVCCLSVDVVDESFIWCGKTTTTTVYRKPTHTDRLLDESSYNPSHKATTIRTLTRCALLVCNSHDSLADERKYLGNVFSKNNYNCDFVTRNTYRTEPNETNTNLTLYRTSKELLKLSLRSYNLTTSVLLTDPSLPYENY